MMYLAMGSYDEARPLFEKELEVLRRIDGEEHPNFATALRSLALLLAAIGRADLSLPLFQQAFPLTHRPIRPVFSFGSEHQRAVFLASVEHQTSLFLSLVVQHFPESREAVGAAYTAVLRRKALLAEMLTIQRDAILGSRRPDLQARLDELNALRREIAAKT